MTSRRGSGVSGRSRPRGRRESSAGGVVCRVVEGRPLFLLIRDRHGSWGFPKGHLERGERPDTAALREVMEETGLRAVSVVQSIDTIEWTFRFDGALVHKRCQYFLMQSDSDRTRPQRAEGITACKWSTLDEARALIPHANALAVLERASQLFAARLHPGPADAVREPRAT